MENVPKMREIRDRLEIWANSETREVRQSISTFEAYLSVLEEMQEIRSWDEVFRSLIREEHHLAFPFFLKRFSGVYYFKCTFFRLLMNKLLLLPGCSSKDAVSRILNAHLLSTFYLTSEGGTTPLDRLKIVFGGEAAVISTPEDYWSRSHKLCDSYKTAQHYFTHQFQTFGSPVMKVLVTYGLIRRLDMGPSSFSYYCSTIFGRLGMRSSNDLNFIHAWLMRDKGRMNSDNQRGFDRIFHIVYSMKVASDVVTDRKVREELANNVEAYWNTLPDPLVSGEEIREFLLFAAQGNPDMIDKMVDAVVSRFGRQAYEPRSLAHLCRIRVRETILQNSPVTLPASVQRLHIPDTFKSFILCRLESTSFPVEK